MEHTKGPWVAHTKLKDRPANHAGTPCVTAGEAGIMIADVWGGEKREANAWLIAASPDLLAALEAMADVALQNGWAVSVKRNMREKYTQARAAIARARGTA